MQSMDEMKGLKIPPGIGVGPDDVKDLSRQIVNRIAALCYQAAGTVELAYRRGKHNEPRMIAALIEIANLKKSSEAAAIAKRALAEVDMPITT